MKKKWKLRYVMALRGIWTGADLKRCIENKTMLRISDAAVSRLMHEEQTEIKLLVLDALCITLDCMPGDLLDISYNLDKDHVRRDSITK